MRSTTSSHILKNNKNDGQTQERVKKHSHFYTLHNSLYAGAGLSQFSQGKKHPRSTKQWQTGHCFTRLSRAILPQLNTFTIPVVPFFFFFFFSQFHLFTYSLFSGMLEKQWLKSHNDFQRQIHTLVYLITTAKGFFA